MNLIIFFGSFAVLLTIGTPIYLALIVPSIIFVAMTPQLPMIMMVQRIVVALNSFPLMAVPFFILAASIMNEGSVTNRIFRFAKVLVGQYRGGLGYVNVLASLIFSGMSGSAIADVGGLGQIELKSMKDAGYDDEFSMGITCASATIGPIIPPSIPFVVFAAFAGVSTGAMFMGGILPGLLMSIVLSIRIFFVAKKRNYPREVRSNIREVISAFRDTWLALLMPIIIIGGIWTGWFTPTEAALASIVFALYVSIFVYKDLRFRDLPRILLKCADTVIPIMMVIIGASLFSWVITYERLHSLLLNALLNFTANKQIVILLICTTVLILGMFFEPIVSTLLLIPLLLPVSSTYGIHPIHLGIIITVGNMIGLLTPPYGMSLFVLSSFTGKSLGTVARYVTPWLFPLVLTWLIVAFFEPLVLFIPNAMGLGQGL